MTDAQFEKLAKAIEVECTKKHNNLAEQTNYYWSKINDRTYNFDNQKKIPALIAGI